MFIEFGKCPLHKVEKYLNKLQQFLPDDIKFSPTFSNLVSAPIVAQNLVNIFIIKYKIHKPIITTFLLAPLAIYYNASKNLIYIAAVPDNISDVSL